MNLEVGMYVRTNYGIGKVDNTRMFMNNFQFHLDSNKGNIHNVSDNTYWNRLEDIIGEPVHNLIELIEVGDFITYKQSNMHWNIPTRVDGRYNRQQELNELVVGDIPLKNVEITSILTKEQFERETYKI